MVIVLKVVVIDVLVVVVELRVVVILLVVVVVVVDPLENVGIYYLVFCLFILKLSPFCLLVELVF
jgi:hypothetical protein